MSELCLRLKPVAPFRLDLTSWALRRRPDNVVDVWDGVRYGRVFAFDKNPILVWVRQTRAAERPEVELTAVSRRTFLSSDKENLIAFVERMLGMRRDLSEFYDMTRQDPHVGQLVERYIGLKPPQFPTIFEALANAIACQQLTVLVGITLVNRLARRWGTRLSKAPHVFAFPSPRLLLGARPRDVRKLGFSKQKTRALLDLAERCRGFEDLRESLGDLSDDEAVSRLMTLHGVGRWSVEYTLLRGLGRLNVFPADDIAGQNNLRRWLRLRSTPSSERVRHLLHRWSPYQGLLYFHFLLANLESKRIFEPSSTAIP